MGATTMSMSPDRFVRAVHWTVTISTATTLVQLGITPIVARLLGPFDFGLFALANVAVIFASHITGTGLADAIIREPNLDRETIGSAILLSWLLSIGSALLTIALAPLAGIGSPIGEKETLNGLIRAMSLAILISGITVPAQALLRREFRFRELAMLQFAGAVLGSGATTIVLASLHFGPWSLVFGSIINVAIIGGGCWWMLRQRWCIAWLSDHVLRIFFFSLKMTLVRLLDATWIQLPLVVAQAKLSPFAVGLYQRGQALVSMGIDSTSGRVTLVLYPALASKQNRTDLLRELIPLFIGLYAIFLFSVTVFVAFTASDIVAILLGPRWHDAAAPLVLIMLAYSVLIISQPASIQLEAFAMFGPRILGAGLGAVSVALLSLLFVGKYGLLGIAAAALISGLSTAVVNVITIARHLEIAPHKLTQWMTPGLGIAGLLAITLAICQWYISQLLHSPAARLATMAFIAAVVFTSGFRVLLGKARRQTISHYLSPDMPQSTIAVARIFGLIPEKCNVP